MKIEMWDIARVKPYEQNPRKNEGAVGAWSSGARFSPSWSGLVSDGSIAFLPFWVGETVTLVVYYFAALRELLGSTEERIELAEPANVADLARALTERHPQLGPHLGSVRFAVNETFVDNAAPLASGDVVALIPPVTGG